MHSRLRLRARVTVAGLTVIACVPAACGSSPSTHPAAPGGAAPKGLARVQECLQTAGYGVTEVPASQIAPGAGESRGPGQTGELLAARGGHRPTIGGTDADAVIAFWRTAAAAASSPNATASTPGSHADVIGSVTVQPTEVLGFKAGIAPAARNQSTILPPPQYEAQVGKIESCARTS